jgi:hypothetical protein
VRSSNRPRAAATTPRTTKESRVTSTAPERAPRRRTIRRWAVLSMAVTLGIGTLAPAAALSAQAADAVPADGLLVQYALDETSGTVAKNTAPDSPTTSTWAWMPSPSVST